MKWHSEKIIVGIRHKKLFKFINNSGIIIDEILPLQGSGPFPEKCFNRLSWRADNMGFRLHDEFETIILECHTEGIIFSCDMDAEPLISLDEIQEIVLTIAIKVLPITDGIKLINRIGIVNEFLIKSFKNSANTAFSKICKFNSIPGIPDNFYTRVAFKNPLQIGYIKGSVNDYKNVILQIVSNKTDEEKESPPDSLRINIDYQIYFSPERNFSDEIFKKHFDDFKKFCEKIKESNLNELSQDIIEDE